jgi:hypothetical protein
LKVKNNDKNQALNCSSILVVFHCHKSIMNDNFFSVANQEFQNVSPPENSSEILSKKFVEF